ncbi:hypothetical protein DYB32_007438 [Aphanomyces invadans]|uniref:CSC1/OSCA1-like 7TM region domain-containing protein n=1 Tax=Aphanomyces invadans TaxID=157072 RepID=A0A3R6Z0G8_9STRA|nr:hypothetical protein DYB32_007438 [Aphanomyces invadans]
MSDASTMSGGLDDSQQVWTSMKIYFPILGGSLIAFEWVRRHSTARPLYACRDRSPAYACPVGFPMLNDRFGRWVLPALRVSDDEIVDACGLDSLCLLRFIRLGRKVAMCGIILSGVLFPVYATAQWTRNDVSTLERIAVNILRENDHRFWAAVVAMYVVSAYTLHLLHREYKDFVARRHHLLSQPHVQQYSVVIRDLPKQLRTCESLKKYLNHLFPHAIHSVVVAVDCKPLEKLVAKREHCRRQLERALTQYASQPQQHRHRPVHIVKSRGTTVDAIDYFGSKLETLNYRVATDVVNLELRQKHLYEAMADDCLIDASCVSDPGIGIDHPHEPATKSLLALMHPTAFVTFRTLLGAHMAQQLLQTSKPTKMVIEAAPSAADIIWENLGLKIHMRNTLKVVARSVTIGIVVFWTVPSTVVTSFSSVESLQKLVPSLGPTFVKYPWLEGLFKQLAPLGLAIMTALAPVMFLWISRREGHLSESQVQTALLHKLVYFQVIQIFAVSVIVGSVLDSLGALVDNPVSIITMLAKAIPAQAAAFTSYLVVKTSLTLVVELFRVGPVLVGILYNLLAPKTTPRDRASAWCGLSPASEPGVVPHSQILPDYFLAILLTLTFCPMSPILCYFAFVYFAVSDVVFRRQLLFVYDPVVHSTGLPWHPLYNFVISALVIAQLTLLGVLSLKKAPGPVVAAAILPILTFLAHLNILSLYPRTAKYLPLLDCVRIDRDRRHGHHIMDFPVHQYVQPAMLAKAPVRPEHPHDAPSTTPDWIAAPTSTLADQSDGVGEYFLCSH